MNYLPALDGLRAVAVAIVLFSHYGVAFLPGGLGVEIFFVLSGFLITKLALAEIHKTGTFSKRKFFIRRTVRIVPPMLATLLAMLLATHFSSHTTANGISVHALLSQVFFYHNYYVLFGQEEAIAGTSVLWSLAVEEHFYVIFAMLISVSLRLKLNLKSCLVWFALGLICYRIVLFNVADLNLEYGYYASEYRAIALLFGCWLAMSRDNSLAQHRLSTLIFLGALALLCMTYLFRSEFFRFQVRDLLHLLLFYLMVKSFYGGISVLCYRLLESSFAVYIGRLSYSIYLCHFFILQYVKVELPFLPLWSQVLVSLISTVIWAVFVRRAIEIPLRNSMRSRDFAR